jgi:cephalosporin hydroxylase
MKYNIENIYGNPIFETGHFGVKYKGVKTVKCPFDYTLLQMIIWDVKPDLIIEIGTAFGGSALYMADLLKTINNGKVHTIDIVHKNYNPLVTSHPNIECFFDGFQNYDITLTKNFNKILVIDDGSHTKQDVLDAFEKFKSLVSKGSYYIVEDGVINILGIENDFGGGPLESLDIIMKNNTDFCIDKKYCNFFGENYTFNPNGYLLKI